MAIRTRFARYLNPLLAALRELGGSTRPGEVYDWVARHLSVSETERAVQNKMQVVSGFYNLLFGLSTAQEEAI